MGEFEKSTQTSIQGHPERMRKVNHVAEVFIFTAIPGRKIATNYSPTPSISLRNVLRLPSKVVPPTLAE